MKATLALINGNIYTMDGRNVESIAILDERIIKVGSTKEIEENIIPETSVIDLGGKTVIPGFNDTHAHLVAYGTSINSVNLNDTKSANEIVEKCRLFIKEKGIKKGEWILGRGWDQNLFKDKKEFPTRKDVDRISRKNPVLLIRTCGHIGIINTIALENLGITEDAFEFEGKLDKDVYGKPNGIIKEASLEWFKKSINPKPSTNEIKNSILAGANNLLKYGITSIHTEDSYDLGYGGDFEDIYKSYKSLVNEDKLPIRVFQKISLPQKKDLRAFFKKNLRTGDGNNYYKIGPVKQWCDGTVGARTAALLEEYKDDPGNKGLLLYEEEELYENVYLSHKENMQVCLHAIGDAALNMVLNVYEKIQQVEPFGLRHRIVHCQVGNRKLYEKIARLGIIINIQPMSTATDISMMNSRLGFEREKECHAWRTLLDLGVCISASSDIPVESPNVFHGIHAIVNRKDLNGNPIGGWLHEQSVTIEEAVKMYTINSAYAAFEEKIKGTLEEGKLADMIVLSDDPFKIEKSKIKDIKVEKTIVGGQVKFSN